MIAVERREEVGFKERIKGKMLSMVERMVRREIGEVYKKKLKVIMEKRKAFSTQFERVFRELESFISLSKFLYERWKFSGKSI